MTDFGITPFVVQVILLSRVYVATTALTDTTYRAAIVDFKPVTKDNETTYLQEEINNAEAYAEFAERAKKQMVDILVFPEYGLTSLPSPGRKNNQTVPDPSDRWNPCLEKEKYNNTEVLNILSCAALNNSIVIVANLLSKELCGKPIEKCPKDGFFQYNTNVVFDKNGTLIARYHKYHLFEEGSLNHPVKPEYVIFDAGFGNMATFVCFDIMYKEPAVELVEKHGIRNLLFPTAWVNLLPYYTAPQWFGRFAYGLGVNVIAANYFRPERSQLGSGIFSSVSGALGEAWDISHPGGLVVADVPINPPAPHHERNAACESVVGNEITNSFSQIHSKRANPDHVITHIPSSRPTNNTHLIYYESLEDYQYTRLDGQSGNSLLCQGDVCCRLQYEFDVRDDDDIYMFAVRNGNNTAMKQYIMGIQACVVVHCPEDDINTCGKVVGRHPQSRFSMLTIQGDFQTEYLYPDIFTTDLMSVPTSEWEFSKKSCAETANTFGKLHTKLTLSDPVLEASIVGRKYEWDAPVQ